MTALQNKKGFICDMDGVIYHGNKLLDGVKEFVEWLATNEKRYLFLTNSSERSPRELSQKLERLGLSVSEDHFYTSAMATAAFLHSQKPNGSRLPLPPFNCFIICFVCSNCFKSWLIS